MDNEQYIVYNHNTLIEIENNVLSFITLIPLKSTVKEDWRNFHNKVEENYRAEIKKSLLSPLRAFEIPSGFSSNTKLGTIYKMSHLYERNTTLQEGLLDSEGISDRMNAIDKDSPSATKSEEFIAAKMALKIEAITNLPLYEKTDFLTVKSMFSEKTVTEGEVATSESGDPIIIQGLNIPKKPKTSLLKWFENYNKEKYLINKDGLTKLYMEHFRSFNNIAIDYEDSAIKINENNLVSWFSRISLSSPKTNPTDKNFIKNNILSSSPHLCTQTTKVYPRPDQAPLKVINLYPHKVTIFSRVGSTTKTYKIEVGEEIKITQNHKKIDIVKISQRNGAEARVILESFLADEKYTLKTSERTLETKGYFLTEVPPVIPENLSMTLAQQVLNDISPETFVQQTEFFKLPIRQQQKNLDSQITKLRVITALVPSMGSIIYDKQVILDKIQGLTAARTKVGESVFYSTRYSFGFSKEVISKTDTSSLKIILKSLGTESYAEAVQSLNKILLPWSYSKYVLKAAARSTLLLVSENELINLIDLKYGQEKMSFERPRQLSEVRSQIKNSSFFVKTAQEVMGVNIFVGPVKFNGLIIAPTGSGKSFFAINMLDGFISANKDNLVWILDRGGSFYKFTETYGGVNKELSPSSSNNSVNPFGLNLSLVLLVKLHYFEERLNRYHIDEQTGKSVRTNKFTPQIHSEIMSIVRLLKIISLNSTSSFYFVSDKTGSSSYNKLTQASKKQKDIFKYIVETDETTEELTLVEIKSEFFVTQIQETFAVLSSIVSSMLSIRTKEGVSSTTITAAAPKILRKLFLTAYQREVVDKKFITDYETATNTPRESFDFETVTPAVYENESQPPPVSTRKLHQNKEQILLKYPAEIIEYSSKNIFFIIEELKAEFHNYVNNHANIEDGYKREITAYLSELDFFIDDLEAGKLFNVEPPKDLSNEKLVNIDLRESQDPRLTTVIPTSLLMNFFKVLTSPSKKGTQKILLIDEAHAILEAKDTSGLEAVEYLFRTARKHNGGIWLISQKVEDFYQPLHARNASLSTLVKNAGWKVVLGPGHTNTDAALGFAGDSIEFSNKKKSDSEKFKMIIDMDGRSINVVDLVVSATDYWNSTSNATEAAVLDVLGLMLGSAQHAKIVASTIFNSPSSGMLKTYSSIASLHDSNPAPTAAQTFEMLKEQTKKNYSEVEKKQIELQHATVFALLSEAKRKQVSLSVE